MRKKLNFLLGGAKSGIHRTGSCFCRKWLEKFRDQKIDYKELVDHYLADDCEALGFQMDCGKWLFPTNMEERLIITMS